MLSYSIITDMSTVYIPSSGPVSRNVTVSTIKSFLAPYSTISYSQGLLTPINSSITSLTSGLNSAQSLLTTDTGLINTNTSNIQTNTSNIQTNTASIGSINTTLSNNAVLFVTNEIRASGSTLNIATSNTTNVLNIGNTSYSTTSTSGGSSSGLSTASPFTLNLGSASIAKNINIGAASDTLVIKGSSVSITGTSVSIPNMLTSAIEGISGALNIGVSTSTSTLNIGTAPAIQTLNIGTNNSSTGTVINIGGSNDTVNIQGKTVFTSTSNLSITDPNILLNQNGAVGSSSGAGVSIQEGGATVAYAQQNSTRDGFVIKAVNSPIINLTQSLARTDSPAFASVYSNLIGNVTGNLTGSLVVSNNYTFNNNGALGKQIVFFDHSPATTNQFDFYGIGVDASSSMRYTIGDAGSHTFYYGTASTAKMLMKIQASGSVSTINNALDNYNGVTGATNFAGVIQAGGGLSLGQNTVNKVIAIYDQSYGSNSSHNFYGFGMSAGNTMRYQVPGTDCNHTWFAATSGTTSNTTMSLDGVGNLNVSASLTVQSGIAIKGSISYGPTIQTKMIALYDGSVNDVNNHIFSGFGVAGNTLRYQVPDVNTNHVWFAAVSSSSSNTLMTLSGGGKLSVSANLVVPNVTIGSVNGSTSLYGVTTVAGPGAGTSGYSNAYGASNIGGQIVVNAGAAPTVSSVITTVTFKTINGSAAYPSGSIVNLTPANAQTASMAIASSVYVVGYPGYFTINSNTTALGASSTYSWYYSVRGNTT